jgi:hypothetical protein
VTSLPEENVTFESVGEQPDAFHCAVRVAWLAWTDRRRNFGELLVLSDVAGLLLGTLAAVPGCVAMLAHRRNIADNYRWLPIQSSNRSWFGCTASNSPQGF